ncbi:MAG TPA: hypothetical protein VIY47_06730 [Ignavibacteriaceae bacterium]
MTEDAVIDIVEKPAKVKKEKAEKKPVLSFQTYKNRAIWNKIRAVSFEEAKGKFIKEIQDSKDRTSYYEIKDDKGRLIPIL